MDAIDAGIWPFITPTHSFLKSPHCFSIFPVICSFHQYPIKAESFSVTIVVDEKIGFFT